MKIIYSYSLFVTLFFVSCANNKEVSSSNNQVNNVKENQVENKKVVKSINGKQVVMEEKKVSSVPTKKKSVNK